MSIPSVSTLSISSEDLGRAMATIIIDRANTLSIKGICLTTDIKDLPLRVQGIMVDTLR
jgi:hypothetical protein